MTAVFAQPGTRKRILAVLALLGAWAVLAVGGATPALAHATVAGSDPAESSRLGAAPSKVTMTFSEDVSASAGFLRVVDPYGTRLAEAGQTEETLLLADIDVARARDKDYVIPGEYELYLFGHRRPELYGSLVEVESAVEA